jgi:segregation and condensation protein A
MPYVVTAPAFEGPIDLLLHLVSTHELDILELPLAPIIDAFVAELTQSKALYDMETLSEFLLVAAILVELKSQRLLPGPDEVDPEDELIGWDERDLLLARLLECRAYAAVADAFVAMAETEARSFPRVTGVDDGFVAVPPDLLAGVTAERVARAFLSATAERPVPIVDLSHVTVDAVSVSEAVADLLSELPRRRSSSFRELTSHLTRRIDVIVHFLAVLELCKMGKVSLGQGHTFGDLEVTWLGERTLVAVGSEFDVDDYDG